MFRIPILTMFIFGFISFSNAQDSAKRSKQLKPFAKHKTYKYHYHNKKPDTATVIALNKLAAPAKPHTVQPATLTDKSLHGQYQFLLTKVYRFQQASVQEFWRNASDTIKINRRKLKESEAQLNMQHRVIDSLRANINGKNKFITASNTKLNEVSLLGMSLSKSVYNLIMWGLVVVFGITAVIVITRSGIYSREAKYRTKLYNELEEEYKTYKVKANDKEKKLARELQTERNKIDELLGR